MRRSTPAPSLALSLTLYVLLAAGHRLPAQETSPSAPAKPRVSALPRIPASIHDALQSREFGAAVEAIDAELAKENPPAVDYLLYLKGRALLELGQQEEAVAVFRRIEQEFPEGEWVSRARFGQADVFVRGRNYQAAGEIYRAEAERLLSHGRKDELAAIYLEFADRYFDGVPSADPAQARQPDYPQALTYYQEALRLETTLPLRQRMEFRVARCLQETGNLAEAIAGFQGFLTRYAGDKVPAALHAPAEVVTEARFHLGAALLAAGKPAEARKAWQTLLAEPAPPADELPADAPQADELQADAATAIASLRARAAYRIAHTFGIPQPGTIGDLELGVAAAERFIRDNPRHELAPQAELEIAQAYLHHGRNTQTVERLQTLIANPQYAAAPQIPQARNLLGRAFLTQRKFDDAINAWKAFLDQHPTDPGWAEVQRAIVNAEFAAADDLRRQEKYDEARTAWQTYLNKYPLDPRTAKILFTFGRMRFQAAADRFADRVKRAVDAGQSPQSVTIDDAERQLFEEAVADWRRLTTKYPGTNEASQGAFMIGATLEDRLGQLKEALEAYRKVEGQFQAQAQQRIARLTEPQLEVATERKFRSNEKPRIRLATRNIEKVTVKIYRIDMQDYFRKMHLAGGVETLDIALIDPDDQLEHAVAGYNPYRRIEQDVELPLEGAGVTAVTVSSEKHEATTMVVVSDLDMIVKASRNELFVFAQNMRTGQPVEGASVLLSNGAEIFATEETGKEGVLQKSFDELRSVSDLRVFALHEGHSASTLSSLEGLDFAVGLAPRGFLYTDRPAYRAGQLVNIRAIVRWVDQDRFTFKPGEKYKLDVYDSRSRLIQSREVALNGYGAAADHLLLPASAPQGDYRVHLHQPAGTQSYETRFTVAEYRLEPVQLAIDLPRAVYHRGEKIEGKLKLTYSYGAPVAGKAIQYQFADRELVSVTTDDQGEAAFSLETLQFSESQTLSLSATYVERGLTEVANVFLATRGFEIAVAAPRGVYVSGESFDATFTVTDPAGKPVGTPLKIEILERVTGLSALDHPHGERVVATYEAASAAEDGLARRTIQLDDAGTYVLRATGTDPFGNTVSGERTVTISGDKDSVRLRILADRLNYQVGDDANVQIHWREAPALALLTYEGASILGYQLVRLETGANPLAVPLDAHLAPNFQLGVAVMERNRFHAASAAVRVAQRMRITLKPARNPVQPGDSVDVEITAVDSQGKPIAAELSLALVQSNLLGLYGDVQGAVDAFFSAGERVPSLRQTTSCTFAYSPATRAISEVLLAEDERKSMLARETEALRALAVNGALVTQFRRLLEQQRFDDAEQVVQQAGAESPGSPLAATMQVQLQLARRSSKSERLAEGKQDWSRWEALNDDAFAAGSSLMLGTDGSLQQGIALPALDGVLDVEMNGNGLALGQLSSVDNAPQALGEREGQSRGLQRFQLGGSGKELYQDFLSRNEDAERILSLRMRQSQSLHSVLERDVSRLFASGGANALDAEGRFLTLNADVDADEVRRLATEGAQLLAGMANAETAFWDPAIVTDANGKAVVTITLPERSTAWTLKARGINGASLAGEADAALITRKDLFGDLKLPLAFTAGDAARILVDVHNALDGPRKLAVTLRRTIGGTTVEQTQTLEVAGPGVSSLEFPVEIGSGESVALTLSIADESAPAAERLRDAVTRTVPIRPYGFPVFATVSGSASQSTIAFVGFDPETPVQDALLELHVGPTVNRTLLEAVLGGPGDLLWSRCEVPGSGIERAVSDILGGTALLDMTRAARDADTPDTQALAGKIAAAVTVLVSAQREDGGWSWSGQVDKGEADRYLTSRVMWALASARKAGFAVESQTLTKAEAWIKTAFSRLNQSNREGQAILLHGLAACGGADFALANRLHRERNSLTASGLVHLALVLDALDRKEMAAELLKLVKLPVEIETANLTATQRFRDASPWMASGIELRALYLLALERIDPADPAAARLADWLLAARAGSRWPVEKANGPAVAALAGWFAKTRFAAEKYTLTVFVNDQQIEKTTFEPGRQSSLRMTVPREHLIAGKPQRINFDIEGRGTFSYSAVLSGFVPADKLKGNAQHWTVQRTYQPAERMLDGQPIPRGFGVLSGGYQWFSNPLTQLPVGERGEVTLQHRRLHMAGGPDNEFDYLILTEPVPAGCIVIPESITGGFERYEIAAGQITFYIGGNPHLADIRYSLVGYAPGDYLIGPSVLRSFYDPRQIAVSTATRLTVLGSGEVSQDEYRLYPDERYHLGRRLMEKGDAAAAYVHLHELFTHWRLNEQVYKETVQLLFTASLANLASSRAPDAAAAAKEAAPQWHSEVVRYFEIIKERYPDVEVAFENILQVAASYRELGEYERSYLVYRATVQGSFERESQVAGFLENRGEFLRSVQVLEQLLVDYPAESYIATATYSVAQEVYRKAAEAAADAKLVEAGLTRVDLIGDAVQMLDHFLSTWPNDPAADQASFALANALLDLEQYDAAIVRCERFAARYPDSRLIDSYWYLTAFSEFALGRHEQALETSRKVAEATFKDPDTGADREADNKWEAVYIMGQIYHSLGRAADAIAAYTRVKDRFADAAEAIDYFNRKAIAVDEITTVRPDDDRRLELRFRNLAEAAIKVYRIDLMKFGLMQRNLDRITAINLAGIKPYHEETVALGDGKDYRDRTRTLTLPLKDEGAYLVVCRGENLYASGLVLVSPLTLAVQEDSASGRVRVTVRKEAGEQFADDVHVKVIGSANEEFRSGETDLRGLFIADDVQGTCTVIAMADPGRYAFYRGEMALQPPVAEAAPVDAAQQAPAAAAPQSQEMLLRGNTIELNNSFQLQNRGFYNDLLQNGRSGIKSKEAF